MIWLIHEWKRNTLQLRYFALSQQFARNEVNGRHFVIHLLSVMYTPYAIFSHVIKWITFEINQNSKYSEAQCYYSRAVCTLLQKKHIVICRSERLYWVLLSFAVSTNSNGESCTSSTIAGKIRPRKNHWKFMYLITHDLNMFVVPREYQIIIKNNFRSSH